MVRYKSLADLKRGFRVLKSEIEIGPVYHRLPDRIKAHASICFIALILYRVMRQRLHAADAKTSPEKALAQLRRIQHHRITLNGSLPNAGLSTTSTEQAQVCNDPVKFCSDVNLEGVEHDEHGHGRRDQTLDGQAQERSGH